MLNIQTQICISCETSLEISALYPTRNISWMSTSSSAFKPKYLWHRGEWDFRWQFIDNYLMLGQSPHSAILWVNIYSVGEVFLPASLKWTYLQMHIVFIATIFVYWASYITLLHLSTTTHKDKAFSAVTSPPFFINCCFQFSFLQLPLLSSYHTHTWWPGIRVDKKQWF